MPALERWRESLEARLRQVVPATQSPLGEAMAYALLGPGKRLRPLMVLGAAYAVRPSSLEEEAVWDAAAALECVHAYSLVHDDLPAMDDDDLRRGRPTVHRVFGEAMAILVGDALQALAFQLLGGPGPVEGEGGCQARLRAVGELARAAGAQGMVEGQALDLRLGAQASEEQVRTLHRLKTGCLFTAAAGVGAYLAGASPRQYGWLTTFGRAYGALYQALDDLLDDGQDQGPSLVRSAGRDGALRRVAEEEARARESLDPLGPTAAPLRELLESALALVPGR
jgi:geranylgeranyl pyrophosphate synthase